jgi:hypothetical protein
VVCVINLLFGTLLSPLQKVCVFSHLYPTPLHVVIGLNARARPKVALHFGCPGFYAGCWIWVAEKIPLLGNRVNRVLLRGWTNEYTVSTQVSDLI